MSDHMEGDVCVNCGDEDTEPYDMKIRNVRYQEMSLCETCYECIERELGESS